MAGRGLGQLFARKSVAQIQAEHAGGELKRTLGPINLILLGIGCIIGTGIFVLTGTAAANDAGPAIVLSFVITGTLCGFVALCYAELASALPVSGSAYSYSYASVGELAAWVMGLLLLLEYGLAASTVAVGWSNYLTSLLTENMGIVLPPEMLKAPGEAVTNKAGDVVGQGVVNLPALLAVLAVTVLLTLGVSESAKVNNVIVAIKVAVVIAFIVIGAFYVQPELWTPFIPERVPGTDEVQGKYGYEGIISGASVIFFAYLGFEAVSTAGAESKNPAKDMPIGIIGSLIVCTILYILTSIVLVGIVPYDQLGVAAPIAMAVDQIGLGWFAILVKVGAIAGLSSVMLVLMFGQTRVFYTMSRDGLIPGIFSKVHPTFKTPWINTLIVGFFVAIAAGFMPLDALSNLTNVGSLVAFAIVCLTVIYLRVAQPNLARPFRAPLFPIVPIAGALMCAYLTWDLLKDPEARPLFAISFTTAQFFGVYLVLGLVVYFAYSMWNSKLAKGEYVTGHEPDPDLAATGQQTDTIKK
jgi:APA family basic amino acid/polyamine antiporter